MIEISPREKRVAAFFDLDGTLTSGPSLEWKYFLALWKEKKIAPMNYFRWLSEALRLAPQGIQQMRHANKMYLRGVASASPVPTPLFLPQALDQAAWHARQGHLLVIVSGTLEPLAGNAVKLLEAELARRGIHCFVRGIATQLEKHLGKWTGRIIGQAKIGEVKAQRLRLLAAELNLDLARCYAYGDSINDIPMLAAVGRPATVNASPDLHGVARRKGWAEILWRIDKRDSVYGPGSRKPGQAAERLA